MSEFIDFGPRFIARRIIRQVLLFDNGAAHICLDNGDWIMLCNTDKESIRNQLNPPPPRYPNAFYLANQETK